VDRLVARRGDADALPAGEQARDQPPGHPRLARAGRPLDHEVAAVEREQKLLQLVEVVRLHGPVERLATQHRLERRVAVVAREQRAAEAFERALLRVGVVRAARDERLGERDVRDARPAPQPQHARVAVELDDLARTVAGRGVERVLAGAERTLTSPRQSAVTISSAPASRSFIQPLLQPAQTQRTTTSASLLTHVFLGTARRWPAARVFVKLVACGARRSIHARL
jgi:hypothetical protein